MDLSKLVSESIQEGKRAMDEREAELRRDAGFDEAAPTDARPPAGAA